MQRPAPEPALLTGAPFLLSQARTMGVSATRLQTRLWRRVCREVYVAADTPDTPELRLAAVALVLPDGAAVSGRSAAWLHGADVRRSPDERLEVTAPRGVTLRGRGLITPLQARLEPADIVERHGVRVTSALRTGFDLARRPDKVEAVVAVDALWHRNRLTPEALIAYAAEHAGLRGILQVPYIAGLADRGAESPMESRLRMVLVLEAGLPRPETQVKVPDSAGGTLARLDIGYPDRRIGVEYDGRVHEDNAVRVKDLRRRNRLLAAGWPVLYYSGDDYYRRRHVIIREVREQFYGS